MFRRLPGGADGTYFYLVGSVPGAEPKAAVRRVKISGGAWEPVGGMLPAEFTSILSLVVDRTGLRLFLGTNAGAYVAE